MGLTDRLLDILYPPKCAFCGSLLERSADGICPKCRETLPWNGGQPDGYDFVRRLTTPFYYEDPVRDSILAYKFNAAPARGAAFGRLIAEDMINRGLLDFDLLTWVPLSRKRLRRRGYDQARLLAEAAAKVLGTEAVPVLKKIRDVPAQSGIDSPEARRANISGCYIVTEPNRVAGKRVLIIDDVITSGSTVSECARMLMLSGAEEVCAAAVAMPRGGLKK